MKLDLFLFCLLTALAKVAVGFFAFQRGGTAFFDGYVIGTDLPFELGISASGLSMFENFTVHTAVSSVFRTLPQTEYTSSLDDEGSSLTLSLFGPTRTGPVKFQITGEMDEDLTHATYYYSYINDTAEVATSLVITRSIVTFTSTWADSVSDTSTTYGYNHEFLIATKWVMVPSSYVTTTEKWTESYTSTTTTVGSDNTVTIIVQSPENSGTDEPTELETSDEGTPSDSETISEPTPTDSDLTSATLESESSFPPPNSVSEDLQPFDETSSSDNGVTSSSEISLTSDGAWLNSLEFKSKKTKILSTATELEKTIYTITECELDQCTVKTLTATQYIPETEATKITVTITECEDDHCYVKTLTTDKAHSETTKTHHIGTVTECSQDECVTKTIAGDTKHTTHHETSGQQSSKVETTAASPSKSSSSLPTTVSTMTQTGVAFSLSIAIISLIVPLFAVIF